MRAIEHLPGDAASGVADVGAVLGDEAKATGGMAVAHGTQDLLVFPFQLAADAAAGAEQVFEGACSCAPMASARRAMASRRRQATSPLKAISTIA